MKSIGWRAATPLVGYNDENDFEAGGATSGSRRLGLTAGKTVLRRVPYDDGSGTGYTRAGKGSCARMGFLNVSGETVPPPIGTPADRFSN